MSLSVIIITKNEAANIAACLESVRFADEVIVLDGNSVDGTQQIAQQHGAIVHCTNDWPGFGPQKNRALQLATKDWVLSLDADERVSPELAKEIQKAIQSNAAAYEIPRLTQFCGQWIRHCGWSPDYVLRLFIREQAQFSNDIVHERVVLHSDRILSYPPPLGEGTRRFPPLGNVKRKKAQLTQPLLHFSYPTPAHYWDKLQRYSAAWAQQRHAQGKTSSVTRALAASFWAFVKSYILRLGFLDGAMGLVVCAMQAQAAFGKHFNLYYLNLKRHDASS